MMIASSNEQAKALGVLGVAIRGADGKLRDMASVTKDIEVAFDAVPESERLAVALAVAR